ncbi:MAG: hypothetical protein FJ271_25250 [Planctomycetes bacterium]|nr:hypothetical protein [Planctomycetota bacterium]
MTRTEIVRQALMELGDTPANEICSFIQKNHGVTIDPKFMPLFKATIQDLEKMNRFRQAARTEEAA